MLAEEFFDLLFGRARSAQLAPLFLDRSRFLLKGLLVPRCGDRRAFGNQVFPLQLRGVVQRGQIGFPGLRLFRRPGFVGHVRSVVLVAQASEVVPELVHEQVHRERARRRCGGLGIEDSATPVGALIHQDRQEIVRRSGGHVTQRAIVVSEDVALGIEAAVVSRKRRTAKDSSMRPADAALRRWKINCPNVEIDFAAAEWLLEKQRIHQALRIGVEFLHLGVGVAIAQDEQVHLVRWRPVLENSPDAPGRHRVGQDDEPRVGINRRGPDLAEDVFGVALLERHLHLPLGPRKPQRLVIRPPGFLRLACSLPLAIDRREAARIEQAVAGPVGHLE